MSTTRTAAMRGLGGSIPNKRGRLTALDAAPEFLLGGEQEVLVERIGRDGDLDPFAAPGDDRERRKPCVHHPHIVLQLG